MSNNKRPLVPAFLQRADDKLLRTKPGIWQIRTHLVAWFAFLFAVLLSLFCFFVFFDARQYSMVSGWVTFTVLVALIGFVFWLIFLLRFNVFKRYGNLQPWDAVRNFALYFLSTGCIVAVCFIPSLIQTFRANQQFGNEEIVNDINELNTLACRLEYDMLPLKWVASKYKVKDTAALPEAAAPAPVTDTVVTGAYEADTLGTALIDSGSLDYNYLYAEELPSRLKNEDSVVKVNDSVYIFYQCPDYNFVAAYTADKYTTVKLLSSAELYRSVIRPHKKTDPLPMVKRMRELKARWAVNDRYGYHYSDYSVYNSNDSYETKIKKKHDLYRINYGISNAVSAKYDWKENGIAYLRVFYYITLVLTLLVFIFRHSTVKTFFLSLLTAVVLSILTGLFMLVDYSSEESSLLSFIIVYYLLFAVLALSALRAPVRRAIQGIGVNIFLFMTPFMPVVFLALNDAIRRYNQYEPGYIERPRHTAMDYFYAELTGVLLLLLLIHFLISKLYRRWYAAPEN